MATSSNHHNQKPNLTLLLNDSIKTWHKKEHYDYQKKITSSIISGLWASRKGEPFQLPIQVPRQAGKTTAVVDVVEFLLAVYRRYQGRPLRIGIFAPQKEQATTDFDRLKLQFLELKSLGFSTKNATDGSLKFPERWNSKSIRLFSRVGDFLGEVYIFPITATSNPESKTLDFIIIEEAQDVDDVKMKNAVFPMGASTNAPRIFIGTAGYRICYFKRQLDSNPNAIKLDVRQVFADRRRAYELDGNIDHLMYERYVENEIKENGEDAPYIQTQFFGKWVIGAGQFTTAEKLDALIAKDRGIITESKTTKVKGDDGKEVEVPALPCYVGIDTAKHIDQTVVTIIRDKKDNQLESELLNWLVLKGDNYEDQFDYIVDFLSNYENIRGIAIDSTGQGDFMPDKFERHTSYNIVRAKFTVEFKDIGYKQLLQVIENKLTTLPDEPLNSTFRQFFQEVIDLEREQKGRFMSVHHPKSGDFHDDYPDSWMLAEHAKTKMLSSAPELHFL